MHLPGALNLDHRRGMRKEYFVYILRCCDGSYYTGITSDLDGRMYKHEQGVHLDSYTFSRRPVQVVYHEAFTEVMDAIRWEKVVKGWKRSKKDALIAGEWDRVRELSKCLNGTAAKHYYLIACHAERSRSVTYNLLSNVSW